MPASQLYDTNERESIATLEEWSERHPVDFVNVTWPDNDFSGFLKSQVFPNYLRSEAIMHPLRTRLLKTEYGETGLHFFNSWRNRRLADKKFEDDDTYELETWLMHIACSWMSSVSNLKLNRSSHDCRNGIINLLELAFQLRAGASQQCQQDAELVLPDDPDAVVADAVAAVPLSRFWQEGLQNFYPLSWSYSNKPESVLTFIFVASKDDSDVQETRERLQMCFFSAQKHRRALCLEDAAVFGATLHDGILDFFVSTWEGDRLVIRPILRRYTVQFFSDFVECYFVLSRLAEYTHQFLAGQFEQWWSIECRFSQRMAEACKRPWRGESRGCVALEVRDPDVFGNNDNTGIRVDVSKLDCVHDRYSRILLASVLQAPHSSETDYPLTRKNKVVFDIITKLDDENKHIRAAFTPSAWVEDTYKHRDEYDDPAPLPDECESVLTAGRPSPDPPMESENSIPAPHLGQTCTDSALLANVTNVRDAEPLGDAVPDASGLSLTASTYKASCIPEWMTKRKGKRRLKTSRKLLRLIKNDILGRRFHRAAIHVC